MMHIVPEARSALVNDFWGGLSAMLVALPASFALGVGAAWLGGAPRLVVHLGPILRCLWCQSPNSQEAPSEGTQ